MPRDHRAERRAGVVAALLRLSRLVAGELRSATGELGLTPAQAEALRFAARIRPDMATPGQLARVLGVRSPTAIGIVAPLVERGLLVRRTHPYDRRRSILALTAAGRDLYDRLERLTADLEAALADLEPAALEQIEAGLGALVGVFVRDGRLVVAAPCAGCIHYRPNAAPGSPLPHRCALLRRNLSASEAAMDCPEHVAAG
ncbi:MarR family transcriptional regulator [Mycobacterium sp. SM1]|nr:MarR family transcriptional regulator [Mycobacterium sp. SM1]